MGRLWRGFKSCFWRQVFLNMISQKFDVVLPGHFAKDKDVVDGKEKNVLGSAV